jgi:prevent-host-death family protein
MTTPQEINVAEAKKKLADLLGRVAYGKETIIITRRGRPMAKLVPISQPDSDHHLAKARGWLADDDPFFNQIQTIVKSRSKVKFRNRRG